MKKAITLKDEEGNQIYPSPYYPIGSIYMSVMQVDPAKIFGGTCEQIEDVFLLGCGSRYKNGTIGGEASHALSLEEIPSHRHDNLYGDNGVRRGAGWGTGTTHTGTLNEMTNNDWESLHTGYSGGSKSHNNMPPYLAVFIWKRIS